MKEVGLNAETDSLAAKAAKGCLCPAVRRLWWSARTDGGTMQRMRAAGQTISQIARATGFDRQTVAAVCARASGSRIGERRLTKAFLSAHMEWLTARAPAVHFTRPAFCIRNCAPVAATRVATIR